MEYIQMDIYDLLYDNDDLLKTPLSIDEALGEMQEYGYEEFINKISKSYKRVLKKS